MSDVELTYRKHFLCRTCLKQLLEDNKYHIFLIPSLSKWLSVCTSLVIEENDGFPKHLCENCYKKIHDFYEFRKKCIKSVQKFQKFNNYLQTKQVENPNSDSEITNQDLLDSNETSDQRREDEPDFKCEIKNRFISGTFSKSKKESEFYSEDENIDNCTIYYNETKDIDELDSKCDDLRDENNKVDNTVENDYKNLKFENNEKHEKKEYRINKNNRKTTNSKGNKSSNEIFICDACGKRFFKHEKYEAHKRIHLGLKPWQCPQCDKDYKKRSSLKNHIKYHHSDNAKKEEFELFVCTAEGCGKSYKFKQTLKAHFRKAHTQNSEFKERNSYMCEQCGKSMSTLAALKRHRFTHSDELPFKCEICSKRYTTKYKLSEHMRRHNGVKNYICSICGLKKISQHELNIHMNFHTKQKQAKCKYCPYASGNIGNVKRHERIVHHGIRAFTCEFCGNSFGKAETLKHHVMTHTGEKPHKCDLCERRFIQLTALKTHLKRHARKSTKTIDSICSQQQIQNTSENLINELY